MWSEVIAGVVGGTIGAAAAVFFQHLRDRSEGERQTLFRIYMCLHELLGFHWPITCSEVRGELSAPETRTAFDRARWRIADELRKVDGFKEMPTILHALFSLRFTTERERYDEIGRIIDILGEQINPQYARMMTRISQENMVLLATDVEEFGRRKGKTDRFP